MVYQVTMVFVGIDSRDELLAIKQLALTLGQAIIQIYLEDFSFFFFLPSKPLIYKIYYTIINLIRVELIYYEIKLFKAIFFFHP